MLDPIQTTTSTPSVDVSPKFAKGVAAPEYVAPDRATIEAGLAAFRAEVLANLDPKRRAAVEKREADTPVSMRANYIEAVGGDSRAAAVKAFCYECCGWQREEVAACTALACPLYAYRPGVEVEA